MTTDQAKCLALLQLINRFGEQMLLDNLRTITVATRHIDNLVAVQFYNDVQGSGAFSFHVHINCETGVVYAFDQPCGTGRMASS